MIIKLRKQYFYVCNNVSETTCIFLILIITPIYYANEKFNFYSYILYRVAFQ